jgi:hypothetical protein
MEKRRVVCEFLYTVRSMVYCRGVKSMRKLLSIGIVFVLLSLGYSQVVGSSDNGKEISIENIVDCGCGDDYCDSPFICSLLFPLFISIIFLLAIFPGINPRLIGLLGTVLDIGKELGCDWTDGNTESSTFDFPVICTSLFPIYYSLFMMYGISRFNPIIGLLLDYVWDIGRELDCWWV